MRLLTWNLNGLDEQFLDERTEAAVFTAILGARLDQLDAGSDRAVNGGIAVEPEGERPMRPGATAAPQPDVMVFQEVTPRMFHSHLKHHLPAGGYSLRPADAPDRETFEVFAYRAPLEIVDYRTEPLTGSRYSRFLHIVDLRSPESGELRVLTGHFDSGTDATKIRLAQLRQVNAAIGPRGIFGGDCNLRKAEWVDNHPRFQMRDAWEVLGSPTVGAITWKREDMMARFDRVFVGTDLTLQALHTYGEEALPGIDTPISDHLGIAVEFTTG
jgi:endonuclease/exonuclease/phosphatase family metal-dependent hydrolase